MEGASNVDQVEFDSLQQMVTGMDNPSYVNYN